MYCISYMLGASFGFRTRNSFEVGGAENLRHRWLAVTLGRGYCLGTKPTTEFGKQECFDTCLQLTATCSAAGLSSSCMVAVWQRSRYGFSKTRGALWSLCPFRAAIMHLQHSTRQTRWWYMSLNPYIPKKLVAEWNRIKRSNKNILPSLPLIDWKGGSKAERERTVLSLSWITVTPGGGDGCSRSLQTRWVRLLFKSKPDGGIDTILYRVKGRLKQGFKRPGINRRYALYSYYSVSLVMTDATSSRASKQNAIPNYQI